MSLIFACEREDLWYEDEVSHRPCERLLILVPVCVIFEARILLSNWLTVPCNLYPGVTWDPMSVTKLLDWLTPCFPP